MLVVIWNYICDARIYEYQRLLYPYVTKFIQHGKGYKLTDGNTFPQKSAVMEQQRVSFVAVGIAALLFVDRKLPIGNSTADSMKVFLRILKWDKFYFSFDLEKEASSSRDM